MVETACLRKAYGETLLKLGESNPQIVVLDADLAKSTQTIKFASKFQERFIDIGLSEQDMVSIAGGIALTGKTVFASSFCVFLAGRAFDQVRQSVCYNNANVKLVGTHSGLGVGEDGATHQTLEDIALMRTLPRMKIVVPADARETELAVLAAAEEAGPFYIRLVRSPLPVIYNSEYRFQIGRGSLLRAGKDITVIACGAMVSKALQAVEILLKKGIDPTLINLSTIKPLDSELILDCAATTNAIITIEDHSVFGGLGGAVSEMLAQRRPTRMAILGVNDQFGRSGKSEELYRYFGLDAESIAAKAVKLLE